MEQRFVYRLFELPKVLGLSLSVCKQLVNAGRIRSFHIGRAHMIARTEVEAFVEREGTEPTKTQIENEASFNDRYFGTCPECDSNDGYVNIHKNHWFYCKKHKTTWNMDSNLFSDWRNENEEIWERNAEMLSEYQVVDPLT